MHWNLKKEELKKSETKKEEEMKEKLKKEEELKQAEQKKKEGGGIFSFFFKGKKPTDKEDKGIDVSLAMDTSPNSSRDNSINYVKDAGKEYIRPLPDRLKADGPPTAREMVETGIIKKLLKSYFKVVKKNIADLVPKAIMALLVNKSKATAQNELVGSLYSDQSIEELMAENPAVVEKRTECKKTITALQDSLKILHDISFTGS